MDPLFSLLIALVIAFPVLAIVALVLAIGARERVRKLALRLARLEGELFGRAVHPAPPPPLAPEAVKELEAKIEEPAAPATPEGSSARPPKPHISLEERFGTQWVVWAGGIALALGGFFLVRYSIEQGWFGPAARVLLAGIVALALIAAGEWTRRREIKSGIVGLPKAHIPSVLTAAGTAIAYADIYAAYALYGFIGPAAAFVLLGIVSLGTLAAALIHGPALAGLGLIGAFITPLIVS